MSIGQVWCPEPVRLGELQKGLFHGFGYRRVVPISRLASRNSVGRFSTLPKNWIPTDTVELADGEAMLHK